jgi:hypothetical protein
VLPSCVRPAVCNDVVTKLFCERNFLIKCSGRTQTLGPGKGRS